MRWNLASTSHFQNASSRNLEKTCYCVFIDERFEGCEAAHPRALTDVRAFVVSVAGTIFVSGAIGIGWFPGKRSRLMGREGLHFGPQRYKLGVLAPGPLSRGQSIQSRLGTSSSLLLPPSKLTRRFHLPKLVPMFLLGFLLVLDPSPSATRAKGRLRVCGQFADKSAPSSVLRSLSSSCTGVRKRAKGTSRSFGYRDFLSPFTNVR